MMSETRPPVPVEARTIGQVLSTTVQRLPSELAVLFPNRPLRWTWSELDRHVELAARGLLALGIGRGEHVAVWATNVPEWIVLQFATARIGAVLVTVNPAYRPHELRYVLGQSDAAALFLVDQFKSSDYFAMLTEVCPEVVNADPGKWHSDAFPKLRHGVAFSGQSRAPRGILGWDALIARGQDVPRQHLVDRERELEPSQPINVQYTSGTTGFPKAAMLSHRNLLLNAFHVGACQELTSADRICIPVPFYHCFGCVMGTLCSAVYGTTMVIPGDYFRPADTLAAIDAGQATSIYGVPTMFIAELEDPSFDQYQLGSLRTGIMAGSPCPIEVMRQVIQRMGAHQMTIAYGQTEASPVITQTRVDDPIDLRVETVGRPLPDVEVKIVDPLTGSKLDDQQPGELCTRGPMVMLGYYKNDEETRAAIDSDQWLHTGDLAVREPNGYYRITGRLKDLVIRGGENIYPREIEEFLFTHPAIEQAAVVGVPDPKYGEELCAWVKLRSGTELTAEQLQDFCRSDLAHFKVPRYVRFIDSFPQTVTGKIQKFKIRDHMIRELGLQPE
jgi:fatty-acyl-CoA synthase